MPTSDTSSCLNTPDADPFSASLPLGGVAPDGPITVSGQLDWWLGQLSGQFVVALFCNADIPATAALREITALLQDSPLNAKLVLVLSPAQEHRAPRSEEHTSELQSLMRTSYAFFCLKKTIHTLL